ncbi:hypothetical protein JNUCC0626_48375 [Lentzea sp. JNUCC 0626]|uniref:hypothetical protein n=1 Tax=Lentzea sp. JNUCC 0626 TaxID=3367513 RepID=UPI003749A1E7
MTKRILTALAVSSVLSGMAAAVVASPAVAADEKPPVCTRWSDANTFGVSCTNVGPRKFQANAQCSDGNWYSGPLIASGTSYVYCSSHGVTYVEGTGNVGMTGVA